MGGLGVVRLRSLASAASQSGALVVALAAVALLPSCGTEPCLGNHCGGSSDSWSTAECTWNGTARVTSGSQPEPAFSECRAQRDSAQNLVTVQLLGMDQSGSFAAPPPGSLTLELPLAPEASLAFASASGPLTNGALRASYQAATGPAVGFTTGTVTRDSASSTSEGYSFSGAVTLAGNAGGNVTMSGTVVVTAFTMTAVGCSDDGASCSTDPTVQTYKTRCAGNPPSQAPCYCAAAATYACFLRKGCYAEAGAATTITEADLRNGATGEIAKANMLNGSCDNPRVQLP